MSGIDLLESRVPVVQTRGRVRQRDCDDWLDVLLPDGGVVGMLRAYFDASTRPSGAFTVAGYLFDSAQARKFRREWDPVFRPLGGMHMTDLVALQQGFKGISRNHADSLIRVAVKLIRPRIIAGVAVSCWVQDVQKFSPRWIRGFGSPYAVCSHLAMTALGIWAKDHHYRDGISYVFEAGDLYADEAHYVMSVAGKVPIVQESYQYRGHGFIRKGDAVGTPLEAADFLAWEWGKFFDETLAEGKRSMRMSLVSLLQNELHKYTFTPMYGERYRRYFEQIRDLGLEQLREAETPQAADLTDALSRGEPNDE